MEWFDNSPGFFQSLKMDLLEQAKQLFPGETGGKITAVYNLRLESGKLYAGATSNLFQRMTDHNAAKAGKTTRDDKPVALIYVEPHKTFSLACQRETQIKRWSRAKKEALAGNDVETLRRLARSRD